MIRRLAHAGRKPGAVPDNGRIMLEALQRSLRLPLPSWALSVSAFRVEGFKALTQAPVGPWAGYPGPPKLCSLYSSAALFGHPSHNSGRLG